MNKIMKFETLNDQMILNTMNADGWICLQIFNDGENWYGLFEKVMV